MKKKKSARLHSERRTRGDDRHNGRGKQNGPHAWCEKRSPAHREARCPARGINRSCAGSNVGVVWVCEEPQSCLVESASRHPPGALTFCFPTHVGKRRISRKVFFAHSHILSLVIDWVKGCHENVQPTLI